MALTIAIVVATLGGYTLGFFAGHAYWSRVGLRIGSQLVGSAARAARPKPGQQTVVDLEVKLLRAQSDLVRLEFKCAELTAQLKAQERAKGDLADKVS